MGVFCKTLSRNFNATITHACAHIAPKIIRTRARAEQWSQILTGPSGPSLTLFYKSFYIRPHEESYKKGVKLGPLGPAVLYELAVTLVVIGFKRYAAPPLRAMANPINHAALRQSACKEYVADRFQAVRNSPILVVLV